MIEKKTIFQNQEIIVHIIVKNEGNLPLADLKIHDESNYPMDAFSLSNGTLINKISILGPGDSFEVTYKLKTMTMGQYTLLPTRIDYY